MTPSHQLVVCSLVAACLALDTGSAHAQWRPGGVPVATTGYQDLGRIASDGGGGAYVVWRDYRDEVTNDSDVYLQHLTGHGFTSPGWPDVGRVVVGTSRPEVGVIESDGLGGALVAWLELAPSVDGQPSGYDIYLQRVLADGTRAPGWPPLGFPVCIAPNYQNLSLGSIARDGFGGAYVVWDDRRDGEFGYISRITHDGQLAPGWPPNGRRIVNHSGTNRSPRVCPDGAGGVLVSWGDSRLQHPTLGASIYALRLLPTGEPCPGWPVEGVPLQTIGTYQDYRHMVSDGSGGAFVVFNDNRQGTSPANPLHYDIYAQHVRGDGAVDSRWPANGYPVSATSGSQYTFKVDTDGLGGFVVGWEDLRDGGWKAYAQRVREDGTLPAGWAPNGTLLSNAPGQHLVVDVVGDGSGGLYAFWERFGFDISSDILGQHLNAISQSAPGWGPGGIHISPEDAPISWFDPEAVSDGKGGALVSIRQTYIHVQRIAGDGPVATRPSLIDAAVEGNSVTVRWHASDTARLVAEVERRDPGHDSWTALGAANVLGPDLFAYTDSELAPGTYAYRLRLRDAWGDALSEETEVTVESLARLALVGFRPNPAAGVPVLAFSLPDERAGRLEVIDVRGRVVHGRDLEGFGVGPHTLPLGRDIRLGAGVYWVRLTHPSGVLTKKGLVVR